MIWHGDLGNTAFGRLKQLKTLLDKGDITFAGNSKLKIYGTLSCSSGKRMKIANRVFFKNADKAVALGYRPCGHCMRKENELWKLRLVIS
ncbi:metal-binding protein [Inquilinus sp. KBS0705]|nr:metal-binding protein [Inquilinus sp. KBS0705]